MSDPQFPDLLGVRETVRPGARASIAGLDSQRRLDALEQGAAGRPGPGVTNGSVPIANSSATGGMEWGSPAGSYIASMYAANSGSPTHTSGSGWQKVGSGGGTLTWTSEIDKRPSGVAAQVDTATNKRIDIKKTGLYRISGAVTFTSITDGKYIAVAVYKNGAHAAISDLTTGVAGGLTPHASRIVSLTAGEYLELYAYQNDSASEAYYVGASYSCFLQAEYLGAAS